MNVKTKVGRQWLSLELEEPQTVKKVQIARALHESKYYMRYGQNVRITIGNSKGYDPKEPMCLPEIGKLHEYPGLVDYICTGDQHEGKYVKISREGALRVCEAKVFVSGEYIDRMQVAHYYVIE